MKRRLLRYLVCPACRSELEVMGCDVADDEPVAEGMLRCLGCSMHYPIRRGIPRFPIAGRTDIQQLTRKTQKVYSFTWRQVGQREVEQGWEKDSYAFLEFVPAALTSGHEKVGLEVGCGGGSDLLRLATGGAELIGIDLSDGVEIAAQMTRHLPNVHLVQADIHYLPLRTKMFDFIRAIGVLHHLPDPSEGVRHLARLLKPGAPLITYLYEDFSHRSVFEQALLALIRAVRRLTSKCPAGLLALGCWCLVPFVWIFCSLPARMLRPWPHLAQRLPFRHTLRWSVLSTDLFDRFAPPFEWRFSRAGVLQLYEGAGLQDVEVCNYRGWVSWGAMPKSPADQAASSREMRERAQL